MSALGKPHCGMIDADGRLLWAETVDLAGGWSSTWVELGLGEQRK
jgi:hypothetical protein